MNFNSLNLFNLKAPNYYNLSSLYFSLFWVECFTNPKRNKKNNNSKKNLASDSIKAKENSLLFSLILKPHLSKTNKKIKKKALFFVTSKMKTGKLSKSSNSSNHTSMSSMNKDSTKKSILIWTKKYPELSQSNSLKNLIFKKSTIYLEEKNLTLNLISERLKTSTMQKRLLSSWSIRKRRNKRMMTTFCLWLLKKVLKNLMILPT